MVKKHVVRLTGEQRGDLEQRFAGPLTLRKRNRIQVLLRLAAGEPDIDIADELGISTGTLATDGLEAALTKKPRAGGPAVLDGKAEAALIGLACSKPPEGHARWSDQLLANRLIALEVVEGVSDDTVRRVLKKAHPTKVY